jgi:hypothetical protein
MSGLGTEVCRKPAAMLRTMLTRLKPRRPGADVAAAVAVLHLGLAWALLDAQVWPDRRAAPPAQALEVRLIPVEAPPEASRPTLESTLSGRPPRSSPQHGEPQTITRQGLQASHLAPTGEIEPAEPAVASDPTALPALRLDLPRAASAPQRWRQPALEDPQANTPRRSLEARIAGTMAGDDRLVEEPLGDGRIRFRRGSDCIVMQRARSALVDPFNQSTSPTPRLVDTC